MSSQKGWILTCHFTTTLQLINDFTRGICLISASLLPRRKQNVLLEES